MADKKGTAWSQIQSERPSDDSLYDVRTGEWRDKPPEYKPSRPGRGWEFDRELSLYVKREADSIEFAVDPKGKQTFGLDQVIRDNPDRAREILNVLKRRVKPEDRWLQGYVKDFEGRLGTGLLQVDRGKGLLTYG